MPDDRWIVEYRGGGIGSVWKRHHDCGAEYSAIEACMIMKGLAETYGDMGYLYRATRVLKTYEVPVALRVDAATPCDARRMAGDLLKKTGQPVATSFLGKPMKMDGGGQPLIHDASKTRGNGTNA